MLIENIEYRSCFNPQRGKGQKLFAFCCNLCSRGGLPVLRLQAGKLGFPCMNNDEQAT